MMLRVSIILLATIGSTMAYSTGLIMPPWLTDGKLDDVYFILYFSYIRPLYNHYQIIHPKIFAKIKKFAKIKVNTALIGEVKVIVIREYTKNS